MHYKVKVLIENCKTGMFREAERTVTLDAGTLELSGEIKQRPIDVGQQERLVRWAVNEAADEVIGKRL